MRFLHPTPGIDAHETCPESGCGGRNHFRVSHSPVYTPVFGRKKPGQSRALRRCPVGAGSDDTDLRHIPTVSSVSRNQGRAGGLPKSEINIVVNWFEEPKKRVPVK
jgi:hypothetical protein